jgi:hypothetical protein
MRPTRVSPPIRYSHPHGSNRADAMTVTEAELQSAVRLALRNVTGGDDAPEPVLADDPLKRALEHVDLATKARARIPGSTAAIRDLCAHCKAAAGYLDQYYGQNPDDGDGLPLPAPPPPEPRSAPARALAAITNLRAGNVRKARELVS